MNTNIIPMPEVVDVKTGEIIPFFKVKPAQIEEFVKSLQPKQRSLLLTDVNSYSRFFKKLETGIKDYIRKDESLKFSEDNVAMYEDWRIKRVGMPYFNKERFEKEATQEEKDVFTKYEEVKQKYTDTRFDMKFG